MSQPLLDGSSETTPVAERLDFLRVLEDSQTPVTLFTQDGQKKVVYISRIAYSHRINPDDGSEEVLATVVAIDASDGLWPYQDILPFSIALSYTTNIVNQTTFVWGPAGADTFEWNRGAWM